jgi:hypothetical protein
VGPETAAVIARVFESATYTPQAFRSCLGILNLARHHGAERLNRACAKALRVGTQSGKRTKSILDLGLEEERQPQLDLRPLPHHENLRGSQYYN